MGKAYSEDIQIIMWGELYKTLKVDCVEKMTVVSDTIICIGIRRKSIDHKDGQQRIVPKHLDASLSEKYSRVVPCYQALVDSTV